MAWITLTLKSLFFFCFFLGTRVACEDGQIERLMADYKAGGESLHDID